ncbi:MAG: 4-(cytidine 5'-diphospho)-2-C-methyl-D-erythritol kinase [Rhodospirillales bacterium]|nr:4-(cytidine 5'-diphospho)-2-C-methyl-D-erythritol kinase [Rhodospirillales bacterium]
MTNLVSRFAPAKLNLYLHVTGKRSDGYHELDSLIAFADVGDTISITPSDALQLDVDGPFAQTLESALGDKGENIVLKAARGLADLAGRPANALIRLTKRIPVAAGLGGGSADAAAAISALIEYWEIKPDGADLMALAIGLGADVPVCLAAHAAFVGGFGEVIEPSPRLPKAGLVLANPGINLPTPQVFANRSGAFGKAARFTQQVGGADELAHILSSRENELTAAAISVAPEIGDVLKSLAEIPGAYLARMSGSGATCFALFDDADEAEEAAEKFQKAHRNWWIAPASLLDEA